MEARGGIRCIVKLGGAAITCKDELENLDVEKLMSTCRQLRQSMIHSDACVNMDWSRRQMDTFGVSDLLQEPSDLQQSKPISVDRFIVIHGAGSFGHFQASRSGIHKGGLKTTLGKAGFVATRISVTRLNLEIVRALASEGLPAVGISPFAAGWSTHDHALEKYETEQLRIILDKGLIPVLHGDAVFDSHQDCTILSGDVVLRKLAEVFQPTHAVFLTNVAGVFDRPPSEEGALLLQEIAVNNDGSWEIVRPESLRFKTGVETRTSLHDTTGGMATKILEAACVAISGVPVYITEAGTSHALEALQCDLWSNLSSNWIGTIVRACN